jgi:hypothetical protein
MDASPGSAGSRYNNAKGDVTHHVTQTRTRVRSPVSGTNEHHASIWCKAVHLCEQLIESLFALFVSVAIWKGVWKMTFDDKNDDGQNWTNQTV